MIITEQMIRELQRRVDISYEDAEKSLRRAGGNIDMAEQHAKKKANSFWNRLFREFEKLINATLIYRLQVSKDEDVFVNVPILVFVIVLFVIGVDKALLLGVVSIILALLADCNLQINKVKDQEEFRFYKTVNKDDIGKAEVNKDDEPIHNQAEDKHLSNEVVDENQIEEELIKNENEDDEYFEVTIDK